MADKKKKKGFGFGGILGGAKDKAGGVFSKNPIGGMMGGKGEQTVDLDFDHEMRRFMQHNKRLKNLEDAVTEYQKHLRAMGKAQVVLVQALESFFGTGTDMQATFRLFEEGNDEIEKYRSALDNMFETDFREPLSNYRGQFKLLKKRVHEREKRRGEYDKLRNEARHLAAHPPANPERIPQTQHKMKCARRGYEDMNAELIRDMPRVYDQKNTFIEPVFATVIVGQATYYEACHTYFSQLKDMVGHVDRSGVHRLPTLLTPPEDSVAGKPYITEYVPGAATSLAAPSTSIDALSTSTRARGASFGGGASVSAPAGVETAHSMGGNDGGFDTAPARATSTYGVGGGGGRGRGRGGRTRGGRGRGGGGRAPAPPASPAIRVRALYDFTGVTPQELNFKHGDEITIYKMSGEWWDGELHGQRGLVPANYVERL